MDNVFSALPKQFKGKALTAFGPKHDEVRLVADLVANRYKGPGAGSLFIAEGLWVLPKLLEAGLEVTHFLFCPDYIRNAGMQADVEALIAIAGTAGYVSVALAARLSDRDATEGFFTVARLPGLTLGDISPAGPDADALVIVMDALDKPGNIGTIIRSAEAAGCDAVISAGSKVRLTNNRLIASSLGSALTLAVTEAGTDECVEWLRRNGFTVYLTLLDGEHFYYEPQLYKGRIAIVAGNEIRGVSGVWKDAGLPCVGVKIPMWGRCDSLNVGFATTMVAYEAALRRRGLRD